MMSRVWSFFVHLAKDLHITDRCTFCTYSSQVIMDPNLDWDKSFLSPCSSKKNKSTLEDKATYWQATSRTVELGLQYSKITRREKATTVTIAASKKTVTKSKKSNSTKVQTKSVSTSKHNNNNGNDEHSSAPVLRKKTQTSLQFVKVNSSTVAISDKSAITKSKKSSNANVETARSSKNKENIIVLDSDDEKQGT